MASIAEYLRAIMEARYGKDVRQSIHDAIDAINTQEEGHATQIQGYIQDAEAWAKGTKNGTPVESTDPTYHNNSKYYSEQASDSATNAGTSATNAGTSETNAAASALTSEAWAKGTKNGTAVPSSDPAYENNAEYWKSQAYYWYLQAKSEAESISGALRPMGTIAFASLPSLASASEGDMYNISDAFQTTSDFAEGAGHDEPAGSNVYKTSTGKWDVLAGSPVSGVKGNAEVDYRQGNVNITPTNIGLGNVDDESITPLKNNIPWYGTCSTAAATTAKVVTTTESKFTLVTGAKVKVKFTNSNTASAPTLNVDSKGAKSIKAYGTTAPTIWWNAGDVVNFTYDGTNWIMGATQGEIEQMNSDLKINVAGFNTTYIHTMNNSSGAKSYTPSKNCLVVYALSLVTGLDPGTGQPSQSANKTDAVTVTRNGVTVASHSAGGNYYAIPYTGTVTGSFLCKAGDTIILSAMLNGLASYVRFYELV